MLQRTQGHSPLRCARDPINKMASEEPVAFDIHDVEITCGREVAFATAVGKCLNTDGNGNLEPLDFRLTMGLRKIDGRWRIMHEHHSLPAETN
jgi:ketosteroid isomerase-like protein